jgi:hypothetical protein
MLQVFLDHSVKKTSILSKITGLFSDFSTSPTLNASPFPSESQKALLASRAEKPYQP